MTMQALIEQALGVYAGDPKDLISKTESSSNNSKSFRDRAKNFIQSDRWNELGKPVSFILQEIFPESSDRIKKNERILGMCSALGILVGASMAVKKYLKNEMGMVI